jgi:hypothetical protein
MEEVHQAGTQIQQGGLNLTPVVWFTLLIVPILALVGIFQIQLVIDLVAKSGYSAAEVFSGIAGIWLMVTVIIGLFEVKA